MDKATHVLTFDHANTGKPAQYALSKVEDPENATLQQILEGQFKVDPGTGAMTRDELKMVGRDNVNIYRVDGKVDF